MRGRETATEAEAIRMGTMSGASAHAASVPLGSLLDGKFRVRREIGRGGMAVVYEAENVDIGKRVAVKVLSAELARSSLVTKRFMREARAAAKIDSPYICDVYDVGTFQGRPFLVMELLEGESLYALLARELRLSVPATLRIVYDAARGLQQAHDAGIVHRDLKPENLFLARGSLGEQRTKIVDFGLAKFYDPSLEGGDSVRLTRAGALFGTPAYMSPEQARADVPVDSRADLWALGCIAYEMLVGQTVWSVDQGVAMILAQVAKGQLPTPSEVRTALPPAFDAWFHKALARDPRARFAGATEMAHALSTALAQPANERPPASRVDPEAPGDTPRPSATSHAASAEPKPGRLGRWGWMGVLVSAGAAIAGTTWLVARSGVPSPAEAPKAAAPPSPVEAAPYALTLSKGQEQMSRGRFTAALASFDAAFEDGKKKTARSLRSHARAIEPFVGTNPCTVSGLGHPRPFEVRTESSPPALAIAAGGLLAAWASQYEEGKERTVFAAQLDPLLRRVSAARPVTPEALDARQPQLLPVGVHHVLLYTDSVGRRSEVRLRRIRRDDPGDPSDPSDPVVISGNPGAWTHSPRGAVGPDGSLWFVYSQVGQSGVHDLFLSHFDDSLRPLERPMRLTQLQSDAHAMRMATASGISTQDEFVALTFVTRRGKKRSVYQIEVALGDAPAPLPSPASEASDRIRGEVTLEAAADDSTAPGLACGPAGCLTVWAEEQGGAQAAFRPRSAAEEGWQTTFSEEGQRPTVTRRPSGDGLVAAVAWYEASRVRFSLATESGLGKPTVVARVGGLQPPPVVIAGTVPGRWYLGWRNYEASVPEAFVARVDCPHPQN